MITNDSNHKLVVWMAPDLAQQESGKVDYKTQLTALNMANLEGLAHSQIAELYPQEAVKHQQFPFKHRYPRCESYADLSGDSKRS